MNLELRRPAVERSPRAPSPAAQAAPATPPAQSVPLGHHDERVVELLEALLAEQRHNTERHDELINLQVRAMESQRASSRKLRVALWLVAIVVPLSVILGQVLPTVLALSRR